MNFTFPKLLILIVCVLKCVSILFNLYFTYTASANKFQNIFPIFFLFKQAFYMRISLALPPSPPHIVRKIW